MKVFPIAQKIYNIFPNTIYYSRYVTCIENIKITRIRSLLNLNVSLYVCIRKFYTNNDYRLVLNIRKIRVRFRGKFLAKKIKINTLLAVNFLRSRP